MSHDTRVQIEDSANSERNLDEYRKKGGWKKGKGRGFLERHLCVCVGEGEGH